MEIEECTNPTGPTHIMINNKQYAIHKDKDKNEGTQTSPTSSKVRKIRRVPRHKAETNGAVWQWQHTNGKWEDYPIHVCQQLKYLHDKETIYYQPHAHGHDQQYTITKASNKIAKQTNVETQSTKKVRKKQKKKQKKKVKRYYENTAYLSEYQIALAIAVIITLLTTLFITVHYKII